MKNRMVVLALVGVALLFSGGVGFGDERVVVATEPGGGFQVGPWGWGAAGGQGVQLDQYMMTLTQLNMTPALTLDKEAKQKLQDIQAEWRSAQAKFMEDHKGDFTKVGQEQMEAFKAKDQEKIKAVMKQSQELYAQGPKGDEYLAKAKAVLTPEQTKAVEASLKKAVEDRMAMMEKWRAHEQKEGTEKPGVPEK